MTAPLVIAHLSDLHLGAEVPDAVATLPADVAAVRPALTVVTGDLTMRARVPQFRAARVLLDQLPRPLLVVPGNHDIPLLSAARLVAPYARYRSWICAELDPVVRLSGLTALGLETVPRWRWKSGRVSRRQSATIVSVLGAAPAGAVRLLALHHPPSSRGLERIAGRGALVRALASARVDLLLAGHTHVPGSGVFRAPAIEVVAGTATSRRTRGAGRSWTVILVSAGAIDVQERRHTADGWSGGERTSYPRC